MVRYGGMDEGGRMGGMDERGGMGKLTFPVSHTAKHWQRWKLNPGVQISSPALYASNNNPPFLPTVRGRKLGAEQGVGPRSPHPSLAPGLHCPPKAGDRTQKL